MRTRFKRLLNRLEIEHVTVHTLRHSFCSTLAENGVNLKTASELMGHADINTTLAIYTHVCQKQKNKAEKFELDKAIKRAISYGLKID